MKPKTQRRDLNRSKSARIEKSATSLANADHIDGLRCHSDNCHISRSEFEIHTPAAPPQIA